MVAAPYRVLCWLLAAAACGQADRPTVAVFDGDASTRGGGGVGSGNPADPLVSPSSPMPGGPVDDACTGQIQGAQETQVDMYIMLDRSASMLEQTGAGPSKWDAMRQALRDFVQDPQSEGLGVGLQYFPLRSAGVPASCFVDSDCGAGGRCASRACLPTPLDTTLSACFSDADCDSGSGCVPFGTCSSDDSLVCFDIGPGGCDVKGDCERFAGNCTNFTSCAVPDYARPAVDLGLLPDNTQALIASLETLQPLGSTPTYPALSGALGFAAGQAKDNPTHRVVVVLATDGSPTECLPSTIQSEAQAVTAVAKIAAQGLRGTPSIPTYVIGVFAPEETSAAQNLQQLATAGGTKQAYLVDESQDVTQQLLEAFTRIRSGSLGCEYVLPESPEGQQLDFNSVNVQLTSSDERVHTLQYVADPSRCSRASLGWYYDADPAKGGAPSKISVCPATCDALRAMTGGSVEIRLGCATEGPS